ARMYNQAGFSLTAFCDRNPERLELGRRYLGQNIPGYTEVETMLRQEDIQAVLIATNDPDHVPPAITSLQAGKHVLVEKPLCQSISDAALLARYVRQTDKIFMIGFELRYCSLFQMVRSLLEEGKIGEVKIGHAFDNVSVGGQYFFHNPSRQKSFFKTLLLQKACHSLDLLNWFMGSHPTRVYAIGGLDYYGRQAPPELRCRHCQKGKSCPYWLDYESFQLDYTTVKDVADFCVWSKEMDLNDNSELCISYASGGKATFHESHFTPEYSREFWLVGTRGKLYAYYDNPGRFLIRIEYAHSSARHTEEWKPPCPGGGHGGGDEGLRMEFLRRIITPGLDVRRLNEEALASGYYSTALALGAETSIETGQAVTIPALEE
ncbi:MAG TPA: Gfo/Idh/MocA family oxidoreductase, partial [bacterium]|nr:Gfo/Idh/MocA family oxidoreductase [bacterium]